MVVLANGCFDPLHYGHVLHLKAAKAMGAVLIVGLTSDEAVRLEKGEGRPMFAEIRRVAVLHELRCVDRVVIVDSSLEALELVRPQIFVKGADYAEVGLAPADQAYCAAHGIEVRFTNTPKWSATQVGDALRRG